MPFLSSRKIFKHLSLQPTANEPLSLSLSLAFQMGVDYESCERCGEIYPDCNGEGPYTVVVKGESTSICVHCIDKTNRRDDIVLETSVPCIWKLVAVEKGKVTSVIDTTPLQIQFCKRLPQGAAIHLFAARLDEEEKAAKPPVVGAKFDHLAYRFDGFSWMSDAISQPSDLRRVHLKLCQKLVEDYECLIFKEVDEETLEALELADKTAVDGDVCRNAAEKKEREETILQLGLFEGANPLSVLVCEYDQPWEDLGAKHKRLEAQREAVSKARIEHEEASKSTKLKLDQEEAKLEALTDEWEVIDEGLREDWKTKLVSSIPVSWETQLKLKRGRDAPVNDDPKPLEKRSKRTAAPSSSSDR